MTHAVKKTIALLIAAALLAAALSGCVLTDEKPEETAAPVKPHGSLLDDEPISQGIVRLPLAIASRFFMQDGCLVGYPYVLNSDMDILNLSIRSAFAEFASSSGVPNCSVSYTVEFNKFGLLSFRMICTNGDDETVLQDSANFDCDTGKRVFLENCFGASYTDYTSAIGGIIDRYLDSRRLSRIGSNPPIRNSTPFFFTSTGIALLFREYELCSAYAGAFLIPVELSEVSGFVAVNGLLKRLG